MYELFEHTADLGLRVVAPDLDTLFNEAAAGLFSMIVEDPSGDGAGRELDFAIPGRRRDLLLFDWLSELLYVFEVKRLLLGEFDVRVQEDGLRARARAWPLDFARHRLVHEVKAVTYHHLRVEATESGWLAELIVDI